MNKRIDEMLTEEGLKEIFNVLSSEGDKKTGVMQAIGYKEFLPLFNKIK